MFTINNVKLLVDQIKSQYGITDLTVEKILTTIFGRNLFHFIFSLIKQRVAIAYHYLNKEFNMDYDDIVLVQHCPTIFLFVLLCKLDDHKLSILLRDVLKVKHPIITEQETYTILNEKWHKIFESDISNLFSEFNRSFLPRFENLISTCIRGCAECDYISVGCKYSTNEQNFRINTQLMHLPFYTIRAKNACEFPSTVDSLNQNLEKVKNKEFTYFYFYLDDYPRIEKIFNTVLTKSLLSHELERTEPAFICEIEGDRIKVFIKLRERIQT